jgi:predicted ATPase
MKSVSVSDVEDLLCYPEDEIIQILTSNKTITFDTLEYYLDSWVKTTCFNPKEVKLVDPRWFKIWEEEYERKYGFRDKN